MKNGFTFKNIHTDAFGITVRTEDRPIYPEAKSRSYEAFLKDGAYDFTEANSLMRTFYKNRTFGVMMQISAGSIKELNLKLSGIAKWLNGYGDLIFDDTPFVKWGARCKNGVKYAPKNSGTAAVLSVEFEVSAFGTLKWGTLDTPTLDEVLVLDTNIPIGMDELFTFHFIGEYDKAASCTKNVFTIPDISDMPLRPEILIKNDVGGRGLYNATISQGEKSVTVRNTYGTGDVLLDFDNEIASVSSLTEGGKPKPVERCIVKGDFFEIDPSMPITLTRYGSSHTTTAQIEADHHKTLLTINLNPKLFWDIDFNSIDWGNSDA